MGFLDIMWSFFGGDESAQEEKREFDGGIPDREADEVDHANPGENPELYEPEDVEAYEEHIRRDNGGLPD